jgi:TonB family protein
MDIARTYFAQKYRVNRLAYVLVLAICFSAAPVLRAQNPSPVTQPPGAQPPSSQSMPAAPPSTYPGDTPPLYAPVPSSNTASPQSPDGAIRVSGGVMAGQLLNRIPPVYPPAAKAAGVQGTVVLVAEIGTDGSVQQLEAISGPDSLRKAALDAVRQWNYKPYLLNGRPVRVQTIVKVNFQLASEPAPPAPSQP